MRVRTRNLTEIYPRHAFVRLILQYNMCFCQVYVRTAHGLTIVEVSSQAATGKVLEA